MSNNQSYQRTLIEHILHSKAASADDIKDPATLHALNVYSNNFIENGIRALAITYPTVVGFIGEDSFRILSTKLLQHEFKVSFDWADYGHLLPEFIGDQEALGEYPFLCELAELDWAIHQSQREADIAFNPTSLGQLQSGDTSKLYFIAAPGLQVLRCWFPVVELYQLIHDPYLQSQEGVLARKETLKNITTSINVALDNLTNSEINTSTPRSLVLWRAEYKATFDYVSEGEAAVIQKIHEQSAIDDVIESISEQGIDLVEWLSKAISSKLIFAVA